MAPFENLTLANERKKIQKGVLYVGSRIVMWSWEKNILLSTLNDILVMV